MPIPGKWIVSFCDERGWTDYNSYDTKSEAQRVARSLRNQGNKTKVVWRTCFCPHCVALATK